MLIGTIPQSWTDAIDDELERRWRCGEDDFTIALEMNRTLTAIKKRRAIIGCTTFDQKLTVTPPRVRVTFPMFENVTKAEARTISAGAPASGVFKRQVRVGPMNLWNELVR